MKMSKQKEYKKRTELKLMITRMKFKSKAWKCGVVFLKNSQRPWQKRSVEEAGCYWTELYPI
jgi:ribosomal protein S1